MFCKHDILPNACYSCLRDERDQLRAELILTEENDKHAGVFWKEAAMHQQLRAEAAEATLGEPMENVGEGIHVYFRKYDDCPTASALWKAIEAEPHWAVAVAFAVQEARAAPKATTNTEQKVE